MCVLLDHTWSMHARLNPHLLKYINKFQNVQKFALRLCVKQWSQDYESLLSICDLPTLATRHKYLGLYTMYRIINGHIFFPPQVFAPRVTPLRPAILPALCLNELIPTFLRASYMLTMEQHATSSSLSRLYIYFQISCN